MTVKTKLITIQNKGDLIHFLESYSLSSALKIDRPYIWQEFFPVPFKDDYVIFHPISKPAKTYDYWTDALWLIRRNLPPDFKILRIGDKNEQPFEQCINIHGQTNFNNVAYLIARAKGYLGTDTFSMHIASAANCPLLATFSSSPISNSGPYWGDKSKQVCIEAPRPGKPSYAFTENPKTINNIKPEEIAEKFVNLLGYPYKNEYKSIHFGSEYVKPKLMQFILTEPIQAHQGLIPEIRMDYHFNEQLLAQELSQRPCFVVTNKPINLNLLKQLKKNVKVLVYCLEKENSPEFAKAVRKLGVKTFLVSFMSKEDIQRLKIDYYEIGAIKTTDKPDPAKVEELKTVPNLFYRSQKILNAGGKRYSSRAAFTAGKETTADFEPVINTDMFWEQSNDFYFVQNMV